MGRTLRALIEASGYTPAAGMSFRNNVTGANTTTKMTDYIISSMDFSGDVPATDAGTYATPHTFSMGVAFTEGTKASGIRRTGSVVTVGGIALPTGASVSCTSNIQATGSTLDVTVVGALNAGTINQYAWFKNYVTPNKPPSTPTTVLVRFTHQMTGGGASGTQTISFNVNYVPNLGADPFNPLMVTTMSAKMAKRADSLADWEYEWHSNAGFTDLLSAGMIYDANSDPGQSSTYYSRIRRPGGSWIDMGGLTFVDGRPLV